MWIVRSVFILVAIWLFLFIKKEEETSARYTRDLKEDSLKFNFADCNKKRQHYEDVRPYMLHDLMTNVLVTGLDSTKVKDLLGETLQDHNALWWSYKLGVYREVENSFLDIEFDSIGKFKRAHIEDR
jgi:hypothetical protein